VKAGGAGVTIKDHAVANFAEHAGDPFWAQPVEVGILDVLAIFGMADGAEAGVAFWVYGLGVEDVG